ncbi:MAG TPA: molybdenum cofactor guanylyltransferase [Gammaproteobacteria bacterium]|nr:molybdenum cofactor guanylyltransferase [Gammaproteobacteria bacterium]
MNSGTITALILAGGKGVRMGRRNKGLMDCSGRPLIEHALQQITPQVDTVLISANDDLDQYRQYHWPVLTDGEYADCGPLAGIYQALLNCPTDYLLTLPCDAPAISPVYAQRMWQAIQNSGQRSAVASSAHGLEPVFTLLSIQCVSLLADYLQQGGRRAGEWIRQLNPVTVDFSDQQQMFTNINTPENLALWQQDPQDA